MKNPIHRYCTGLLALLFVVSMSACTLSDPVQVEADFGNSVRHMIEQQKQTPMTDSVSPADAPSRFDGDSAINSLDQYRSAQKRKVPKKSLDTFDLNE